MSLHHLSLQLKYIIFHIFISKIESVVSTTEHTSYNCLSLLVSELRCLKASHEQLNIACEYMIMVSFPHNSTIRVYVSTLFTWNIRNLKSVQTVIINSLCSTSILILINLAETLCKSNSSALSKVSVFLSIAIRRCLLYPSLVQRRSSSDVRQRRILEKTWKF